MRLPLPRTLFARLMLIWLVGISTVLGISYALFLGERERFDRDVLFEGIAREVASAADVLEPLSATDREAWIDTLGQRRLRFELEPPPDEASPLPPHFSLSQALRQAQPDREVVLYSLPRPETDDGERRSRHVVTVTLNDGSPLSAHLRSPQMRPGPSSTPPERVLAALAALIAGISLLAWVAVKLATRPLSRLADAARALGENPEHDININTRGPAEVAQAATAFGQMQQRILQHVSERTRILAAISHDLQTPITRLRLRAEQVDDSPLRERIQSDLDAMQALVREGLDYARSLEGAEPLQKIDLQALLETLCDNANEFGWDVTLTGEATTPCRGRYVALQRSLWNLIENGAKFGDRVEISLAETPNEFCIDIRDYGPGLDESELERVFEPFYRTESSRSRETGGTGLGLAIARNLLRAQGGDIQLENASGGGLLARITLSRHSPEAG